MRRSASKVHRYASRHHADISTIPRIPAGQPGELRQGRRRVPMAGPGTLQLGARLVRRGAGARGRQQRSLRPLDRRRGDRPRDEAHLRRTGGALQPGRQLPASAGAETGRPSPARPEQRGAAMGDHARGHEAGRRGDSGDDPSDRRRAGRPGRARPRTHDRGGRGAGRQMRAAVPRRRRLRHHELIENRGMAAARRRLQMPGRVQAGRSDQRRRSAAALFHLGHDSQAQARAPQPSQLSRRRPVDDVLAGAAARRRASQYLLARLGEARLEHVLRAVERGLDGADRQPGAVQRQGPAGRAGALRRHYLLRAAHRMAPAHPGGSGGLQGLAARGLRRG